MLDLRPTAASPLPAPASPLLLCDHLISLAQEAGRAGHRATATQLIRLAHSVLDEAPAPRPS